jgi:2-(1,2-epoxy-1,2-dihydrophenyl)acetyl-CoA isomerase
MWKAKEWIFTGKVLSMEEAREYQLVNRIVPEAELMTQVYELAEELAAGPAHAIGLAKNIINMTTDKDLRSTVEYEHFAQLLLKQTADHKEGVAAFKEKRKPEFNQ